MRARTAKTKGRNDRILHAEGYAQDHADPDPQGLLTRDVIRRHIAAQTCPFCPLGPFKSLASHTSRTHGVDRFELRELAGMTVSESIASPELAAQARAIANRRGLAAIGAKASKDRAARGEKVGPKVHTSVASERVRDARLREHASRTPEERSQRAREMSLAVPKESRVRQGESLRQRHLANPPTEEEIAAFRERMASPQAEAKRRAAREARLQGHGSVASYKRGCRCDDCSRAKARSRKKPQA